LRVGTEVNWRGSACSAANCEVWRESHGSMRTVEMRMKNGGEEAEGVDGERLKL
jgi:hypothetical protein